VFYVTQNLFEKHPLPPSLIVNRDVVECPDLEQHSRAELSGFVVLLLRVTDTD